jgi:hypothetical protein
MKVIAQTNSVGAVSYTARLQNGYEGTPARLPNFAKAQAMHEYNKDLRMVNARASDFGVKIRYEDVSQAELDKLSVTWTPRS